MEKTKIYCDRCGKEIKAGFFRTQHFNLCKSRHTLFHRSSDEPLDLCQSCINSLEVWLKLKDDHIESISKELEQGKMAIDTIKSVDKLIKIPAPLFDKTDDTEKWYQHHISSALSEYKDKYCKEDTDGEADL